MSFICNVSSCSDCGVVCIGSAIDGFERRAGREGSGTVAEYGLGKSTKEVGPLYGTGLLEREAARKDRYWLTLGMYRV